MDGGHFDALTRGLSSLVDRRTTARAIVGGALGGIGLAASHDAEAKKKNKKKCKRPKVKCGKKCCAAGQFCVSGKCAPACQFTKTPTLWTVQGDCATKSTIVVPDGVTLDGAGNTIQLAGPASGYQGIGTGFVLHVGFLIQDGTGSVRNLTIDQDPLSCGGQAMTAILFQDASGSVESTSIRSTNSDPVCRRGIRAEAVTAQTLDVTEVAIAGRSSSGIDIIGPISGTISDSSVSGHSFGIQVGQGAAFTIDGNTLTNLGLAINTGSPGTTIDIQNNTITGQGASTGVSIVNGADVDIDGNAISNFFCGILIDASAGVVTIGTNTFPAPGNTQNVCDNQP